MVQIINGLRYDTDSAEEVCSNRYWDGSNWDRNGRTSTLYKTKNGRFFVHHETRWQGERDHIRPVDADEAREIYEQLPERAMSYEDAFGVAPEEA